MVAFSKALLNKARFSCVFILQFYLKGLYVHSVHFPFNHPSRSSFLQLCCNFKPLCFDRFEIQTIIAIFFYSIFSQRLYLFPTFAFKAIPYSTWNNRGADQMAVWIPEAAEYARPTPEATIASKARTLMIQAPIQKDAPESASVETWAWGVNDQWEPKRSSDISKPYHSCQFL